MDGRKDDAVGKLELKRLGWVDMGRLGDALLSAEGFSRILGRGEGVIEGAVESDGFVEDFKDG